MPKPVSGLGGSAGRSVARMAFIGCSPLFDSFDSIDAFDRARDDPGDAEGQKDHRAQQHGFGVTAPVASGAIGAQKREHPHVTPLKSARYAASAMSTSAYTAGVAIGIAIVILRTRVSYLRCI